MVLVMVCQLYNLDFSYYSFANIFLFYYPGPLNTSMRGKAWVVINAQGPIKINLDIKRCHLINVPGLDDLAFVDHSIPV